MKFTSYIKFISSIAFLFCIACPFYASDDNKENTKNTELFANQELLNPIFEKLANLESSRAWKVNIVHIGDSHIQADFLTDVIRSSLQAKFGDGGYGFTFPYSLMRTNGASYIKYSSNATWKSRLNVSPISRVVDIGLSGIGLYTDDPNFTVQINTDKERSFNSVKVLYSTEGPQYQMALTENPITTIVEEEIASNNTGTNKPQTIHNIRRGENLSVIAARYKTTVRALKLENRLTSDHIEAGKTLVIPTSATIKTRVRTKVVKQSVDYVNLQNYPYYSSYISIEPLNRISIFTRNDAHKHDINGFVLENDKRGLVYHTIGVNGAKISDFNKYSLFFRQLKILQPDLVVLSFGTNESYQKLSAEQYLVKLNEMVDLIQKQNPNAVVLVMTPPPSMIRRRTSNVLVGDYSKALMNLNNLPIWDLYNKMDGENGIINGGRYSGIIARDKIHYTFHGYKIQGDMFAEDFMKAYTQYKKNKHKGN